MSVTVTEWVVTWWRDDGPGTSIRSQTRTYGTEDEARQVYTGITYRKRLLMEPARIIRRRLERVDKLIDSETIEDEDLT